MSPGQRASAELARDPRRSDALIAAAAQCTSRTVQRQRRVLERAGVIAPVPRLQRTDYRPSRNPGAYQRALAQLALGPHRSNRAIARAAACSAWTVLAARRAALAVTPAQGHTVAMGNKLSAPIRTAPDDPHALTSMQDPATREPARYAAPPDSIELACCTAEWQDGSFRHDRACLFAGRKV